MALKEFPHSSPDSLQRAAAQAASETEDAVTADTKYGKAEVNYREAGSSNTRCERCSHFRWAGKGTGTCRIVAGRIGPQDVCDKYEGGGGSLMDLVTGEATR